MTDDETPATTLEAKFGAFLRREREMRRVEVDYIAKATRISVGRITDLERGNWQTFGAFVYLRGAVSGYARAAGLDVDDILLRLEAEVPHVSTANEDDLSGPLFHNSEKTTPKYGLLPVILTIAILIAVTTMAWLAYQREAQRELEIFESQTTHNVLHDFDADITVATSGAVTEAAGAITAGAVATEPEPAPPEKMPTPISPAKRLVIYALETSWIEYSIDEGPVKAMILESGKTIKLGGLKNIHLRTGNAGGVKLTLDGIEQPPLGEIGSVRERTIRLQ